MKFTIGRDKILLILTILFVLAAIYTGYRHNPYDPVDGVGDDPYYLGEAYYLAKNGFYLSLCQCTSFLYTLLIYLFSKIFFCNIVMAARILSVVSFLGCCFLVYLPLQFVKEIKNWHKALTIVFFCTISRNLIFRCLPDFTGMFFFLAAFYFVLKSNNLRNAALAGALLFLEFCCKPVAVFFVPAFGILMLILAYQQRMRWFGLPNAAVLALSFSLFFALYHLPGYKMYHKLMLEDKFHYYSGPKRIEMTPGRREIEVYYLTIPNRHANIFTLSAGEVDSFEKSHPNVNLDLGYLEFVKKYPGMVINTDLKKMFVDLPYAIQGGFFYSKWTVVNKWVHSYPIIWGLSAVLFFIMLFGERKFIVSNAVFLLTPFLFELFLALYSLGHFEGNWILLGMPFLALPIIVLLCRRINIYLIFLLQFLLFIV